MSAQQPLSVFIIGITGERSSYLFQDHRILTSSLLCIGYIGGAVSLALLKEFPSFHYKAFTRTPATVKSIKAQGFEPVLGGDRAENLKVIGKCEFIGVIRVVQ